MLHSLISTLAISLLALATPAKCASLLTLQALNYNNLGPQNNGTPAVLVRDAVPFSTAQDQCSAIGERLYPLSSAPQANLTELQYQLDYLVFNHDLSSDVSLWVAQGSDGQCEAYSHESKQIVHTSCDTHLPAICTSTVPPTTEGHPTAVDSSKVPLTLRDFNITGYRDARSFRFLGIPFANPPVGELRFQPPQPYSGSGEIDATTFSDSCIQAPSTFAPKDGGFSEDCLYLNVYTPVLPAQGDTWSLRRPVAVYFYGGAFTVGGASLIDYDGGNFASRNDVVIVTVNYRLGALGFLSTGNLTTGSYGIQDQIMALQWVNKYIFAFGGDPSQVTIFGQSAGGQSVVALLSSSAAKGLFSSAISQSNAIDFPWFTRQVYADLVTPEVAKAVGCNSTTSEESLLSCLRSVPAIEYAGNSSNFQNALSASAEAVGSHYLHVTPVLASIEPFMPIIDDSNSGVIDAQFYSLLANNSLPNSVPTMFTTVTDEAYLYADAIFPPLGSSQSALDEAFKTVYPADLATDLTNADVFPVNTSSPDGTRNAVADALTCSSWTCPQAFLLDHATGSFPSLFAVEIGQGHIPTTIDVPAVCSPNPDFNASCHTSDIILVWGTLNTKSIDVAPYYDERDLLHSQMLNDVFGAFIRSNNPNPDPEWLRVRGPAYEASYRVFGDDGFSIDEYVPGQKDLSLLDIPPRLTVNPGVTNKCEVFTNFGYTFQHANLTV